MDARSYLNAAWAHLTAGSTPEGVATTRELLRMKFDWEMTEPERKRAEAYRRSLLSGGISGQRDLLGKMGGLT